MLDNIKWIALSGFLLVIGLVLTIVMQIRLAHKTRIEFPIQHPAAGQPLLR